MSYILDFKETDNAMVALVGGKGANLGALATIEGLNVPGGFCITTDAYGEIVSGNPDFISLVNELAISQTNKNADISHIAARIRQLIESIVIPKHIEAEITQHVKSLGDENAYAIRSSATAEDLATASFAGLQDTYLNVIGLPSILKHVARCWASLFTDRAVIYRFQNGFDHRSVHLAVVVQKMIFPDAAGIMFTADPISGNRKVVTIDASVGLGEALVSGIVNADNFKIREGKIISKKISSKKVAIVAADHGGTIQQSIDPSEQNLQTLDDQALAVLERIGRRIEKHFGKPQDIEWCLTNNIFYIVQSRPITTLFPLPAVNDGENHIYISVGHQQMMTDVMKPLGLSIHATMSRARMYNAGGRLFVDVAPMLQSPIGRKTMIDTMGQFDPLIKDALLTVLEQGEMIKVTEEENSTQDEKSKVTSTQGYRSKIENDPAIVSALVEQSQKGIEALRAGIKDKSGLDLMEFIADDIQQLQKRIGDPQNMAAILGPMDAATWLNEKINEWLGEKNVADTISQSVPNNITSEMGMALLDVADVIRPFPEVISYLEHVDDDNFLNDLKKLKGGNQAHDAINSFLAKYGMRCAGEIDITRTRWAEKPSILVPIILTNIKSFRPGESRRKFEQGLNEALNKEQDLLRRLRLLADGEARANEVQSMISFIRNFSGYREYPKYAIVNHYFIYRQALLEEAERLVKANIIRDREDIYYLSFEELREVVATQQVDQRVISNRKQEYKAYEKLTPPRVITSDGEMINGKYNRENVPEGAIAGLAVSSGIIEGRARVILSMEDADIEDGDILVTSFTDPSWTPLFVSIKGLVTEVGGLMTHGAVIAREYGLPAVVGVDNATRIIKDGQRIRVNGTEGFVEVL